MRKPETDRLTAWIGLALALLPACSSMQVKTAADPEADLSKYETYAWAPQKKAEGKDEERQRSLLEQTLVSSVEQELASKGLEPAKGAAPDLLVSYFGGSSETVNYSAGPYYGYPYYSSYGSAYVTREGSLTLQLIDAKSKRIVWQGTATDVVDRAGASPEQVRTAVVRMLEQYPSA